MATDRAEAARLRAEAKRRGLKRCPTCGRARRRSSFSRHAGNADGLQSCCKDCVRERDRAWKKRWRAAETPTHRSWRSMIARCEQPSMPSFAYYGGRGVWVCDRWRYSFDAFLEDLGERPSGKTLDRLDSDGDYQPGNCRWATPKEQVANRRARA